MAQLYITYICKKELQAILPWILECHLIGHGHEVMVFTTVISIYVSRTHQKSRRVRQQFWRVRATYRTFTFSCLQLREINLLLWNSSKNWKCGQMWLFMFWLKFPSISFTKWRFFSACRKQLPKHKLLLLPIFIILNLFFQKLPNTLSFSKWDIHCWKTLFLV